MVHAVPTTAARRLLTMLAALAVVLASTLLVAPQADAATRWQKVQHARQIAVNQLGDPYRYGAAGPHRFDCSGLIYFATHRAGLTGVPRSSGQQARFMSPVKKRNMRRGDFMFFYNSGGVYHAAIFLGWDDGRARLLHSPRSGSRVHRSHAWTSSWFGRTLRW